MWLSDPPEEKTEAYRKRTRAKVQQSYPYELLFNSRIAYLKTEKLLKVILSGHEHCGLRERFSDTAVQYVAGANFHFHANDVLIM